MGKGGGAGNRVRVLNVDFSHFFLTPLPLTNSYTHTRVLSLYYLAISLWSYFFLFFILSFLSFRENNSARGKIFSIYTGRGRRKAVVVKSLTSRLKILFENLFSRRREPLSVTCWRGGIERGRQLTCYPQLAHWRGKLLAYSVNCWGVLFGITKPIIFLIKQHYIPAFSFFLFLLTFDILFSSLIPKIKGTNKHERERERKKKRKIETVGKIFPPFCFEGLRC